MRRGLPVLVIAALLAAAAHAQQAIASRYLFVWTGDGDRQHSDFLAVLDVDPASATYGDVLRTVPIGERSTNPHHTEHRFTPGRPLFASGFGSNRVFRFDLTDALRPRLLGVADAAPTLTFLHSFERLPNGNILGTMQTATAQNTGPGGLVEYRDDGTIVRTASAAASGVEHPHPYSLLVLSDQDRVITASGRMGLPPWDPRRGGLAQEKPAIHLQLWRLSDLRLLKTLALEAPPGTQVNVNPYEPRRMPDGQVLVSSASGGLYRVRGFDPDTFSAEFVYNFASGNAAVPVVIGRFWVQPLGTTRRVVSMDVSDAAHPKEVSHVQFDDRQQPHWLAHDALGNRIVVANSGTTAENRLWMLRIDPGSGALSLDESFRARGSDRPGISFDRESWPHGDTGAAIPHGSVFGR